MSDSRVNGVHWSFWAICIAMFVWNAMGALNFVLQLNPDNIASYRETEQAIVVGRPLWATTSFFFAVFGGTFGCVLLLFKKATAFYVFIASLAGVVLTQIHALSQGIIFGVGEVIGIVLMPVIVAVFLVWYSKRVKKRGWIN